MRGRADLAVMSYSRTAAPPGLGILPEFLPQERDPPDRRDLDLKQGVPARHDGRRQAGGAGLGLLG